MTKRNEGQDNFLWLMADGGLNRHTQGLILKDYKALRETFKRLLIYSSAH